MWEYDRHAEATLDDVENLTGARPVSCPWRAFHDPLVREVLALYRAVGGGTESGPVPTRALDLDPPFKVYEGLLHYTQAAQSIRFADMQREREAREREQKRGSVPANTRRVVARG